MLFLLVAQNECMCIIFRIMSIILDQTASKLTISIIFIIFLQPKHSTFNFTVTIFSFQPRVFQFYHTCDIFTAAKPKIFSKVTTVYFTVLKLSKI